jgi:hypothetical protein
VTREIRRDDRSSARAEDQIELLVQGAPNHRFDFFQHAQGVEALGAAAI